MKKRNSMLRAFLFLLAAGVLLCGCGKEDENQQNSTEETVNIPMIFIVDSSTGIKKEEDLVKAFNKEYSGKYKADAEWIMETEEEYRQNMKRLNVSDDLPAVISELRLLPAFYQKMIEDGRVEDLSSYIDNDEEWKEMVEEEVLLSCTEPDGKIYLAPLSTAAFSCSGIFWNEELFNQAGIDSFPQTWEEFWECCEKLKAHKITPLALHTEGTAWAPMLLATAELSDNDGGMEFMKSFPETFCNESGVHIAETLKRLFSYTTEDALYHDFDVPYKHFFAGEAAMLPNGYWMIEQIPLQWRDKVRFSAFPGNKLICSPETFGWSVVSSYSREVKDGAVSFLKFRTKRNLEQKKQLFSGSKSDMEKAKKDYIKAYKKNPSLVPNYQVKWDSRLQEKMLGAYLPKLVKGEITVWEFTKLEDECLVQE